MIDRKAYNSISYSISIVGSLQDGKYRGCVVNSLQQLTSSSPAKFAVTLNKYNLTEAAVEQTDAFCATVAAADCRTTSSICSAINPDALRTNSLPMTPRPMTPDALTSQTACVPVSASALYSG